MNEEFIKEFLKTKKKENWRESDMPTTRSTNPLDYRGEHLGGGSVLKHKLKMSSMIFLISMSRMKESQDIGVKLKGKKQSLQDRIED